MVIKELQTRIDENNQIPLVTRINLSNFQNLDVFNGIKIRI